MAAVQKTYMWMGPTHTEQTTETIGTMREAPSSRGKSKADRLKACREIRTYLEQVKRDLYLTNGELSAEESSAYSLAAMVRGHRYRTGRVIVSYLDGTAHESDQIHQYNTFARGLVLEAMHKNGIDPTEIVPEESAIEPPTGVENFSEYNATATKHATKILSHACVRAIDIGAAFDAAN